MIGKWRLARGLENGPVNRRGIVSPLVGMNGRLLFTAQYAGFGG